MTPELKAAVRGLGLTGLAFAALLKVANTTVSGWGRKQRRDRRMQEEPIWAWHLVRAWTRYPDLLAEAIERAHEADTGDADALRRAIEERENMEPVED